MTFHDLTALFGYSYWPNRRLFVAISPLTLDELTRPVGPGTRPS